LKDRKWYEFDWWKNSIEYEIRDKPFERELNFIADALG